MIGMYLTLRSENWDPDLDIFIHEKGSFFYQDDLTFGTTRVSHEELQKVKTGHPRISGRPFEFVRLRA